MKAGQTIGRGRLPFLFWLGGVLVEVLYGQPTPNDAIARAQRQLERGDVSLENHARLGYLPSLLKLFDINPDSQALVFAKTSFQQALISPNNPRAIFFNDEVSIGAVP